jgi:hypothetical protein
MRHFVFLANAEPTLKNIKRTISVCLIFLVYAQCKLNTLKRTLSLICRNCKKGIILSLH